MFRPALALIASLFLATLVSAQDTRVRYTVNVCTKGTSTPITTANQYDLVDVVVYVQQEAAPGVGQGVFAAYCDVVFDEMKASLNYAWPSAFKFSSPYTGGLKLYPALDGKGVIRSGGFSGSFTPLGVVAREVYRFRVWLEEKGTVTFMPSVANCRSPMEDTLVYGQNAAVTKDCIDFKGSTITVK